MSNEIPVLARELRSRMGWTQAELAARLLISRNYLSLVEGGHKAASARLQVALRALAASADGKAAPGEPAARRVPLLRWAEADAGVKPGPGGAHVVTACADPGAFAVEIEGEAMLPDFKPGDRVVVVPAAEPQPGRPVLAGFQAGGMVLRLYHPLNPRTVRLSSLRPEIFPPLDGLRTALRWVWPVVELSRKV